MCPLTRLVHSLNDCFDDRAHWYTHTTDFSCLIWFRKNNNNNNPPTPNIESLFHFKSASHSTLCRHTHFDITKAKQKRFQCNAFLSRSQQNIKEFFLIHQMVSFFGNVELCDKLNTRRMLCCISVVCVVFFCSVHSCSPTWSMCCLRKFSTSVIFSQRNSCKNLILTPHPCDSISHFFKF